MNIRNLAIVAGLLIVLLWWKGGVFVSMPTIASAGTNQIQVGEKKSNQARYEFRSPAGFGGTVVSYDFNSFGVTLGMDGSFFETLGARAILTYTSPELYEAARAQSCRTGECMASTLGQLQARGRLSHLILIPENEDALKTMKKADLSNGSRFVLSGRYLALQSVTMHGQPVNVNLGDTGFFLVSRISAD